MDLGSGIMKFNLWLIQPEVEKFNLKLNKKKASSSKPQASSLTAGTG